MGSWGKNLEYLASVVWNNQLYTVCDWLFLKTLKSKTRKNKTVSFNKTSSQNKAQEYLKSKIKNKLEQQKTPGKVTDLNLTILIIINKESYGVIVRSAKVDFRAQNITRDKKRSFHNDKGSVSQEDIIVLNIQIKK